MKTLRSLRRAAGFSQREAAVIYGCTQAFVSFVERGRRTMRHDREARLRSVLEAMAAERERAELDRAVGAAVRETELLSGRGA
jgi:transcriptional regulator with XRE-family HTH domain